MKTHKTPSGFKIPDRQLKEFMKLAELGGYDGSHHKDWVLQELIKMVKGWDEHRLQQWLDGICWERGIAP